MKIHILKFITWVEDGNSPYKHAIAPYGTAMAGLPSQIAYGSWKKIHHAILLWWHHICYLTTLLSIKKDLSSVNISENNISPIKEKENIS